MNKYSELYNMTSMGYDGEANTADHTANLESQCTRLETMRSMFED